MIVPHQRLSPEALDGLVEEFVTRDGTELGEASVKAAAVRRGLESGALVVVYDPETESCNIVSTDELASSE